VGGYKILQRADQVPEMADGGLGHNDINQSWWIFILISINISNFSIFRILIKINF
jgi:hypothetical protein